MGSEFVEKQRTARNIAKLRQICEERVAGTTSSGKVSERRRSWPPSARRQLHQATKTLCWEGMLSSDGRSGDDCFGILIP